MAVKRNNGQIVTLDDLSKRWASHLGLATSPLFGKDEPEDPTVFRTALLDGIAGSFTMSDYSLAGSGATGSDAAGADWSWSSLMRHHVTVNKSDVTTTRSDGRNSDKFSKTSVEGNLDDFFTFLEKAAPPQWPDAIDHTIRCFQNLRAELPGSTEGQLASFLVLAAIRLENPEVPAGQLADLIGSANLVASKYDIDLSSIESAALLPDLARRFYEELLSEDVGGHRLYLNLTIRHASGELFQAAHLAPAPPPLQRPFFGLANVRVRPHSLKGVAYTPLGLARSLAEEAIVNLDPTKATTLTVLDPACGSGTFLIEILAALSRRKWPAKVKLIGYDISETAIASARFALACAVQQQKGITVETELKVRDFLAADVPSVRADITIMNPPYLSWSDLTKSQRNQLREVLGANYRGRPDLSMAFVDRAVRLAPNGGTIVTLLPIGVLAGESAAKWRRELAETAHPRLIGALGDHTLFRFATVNISTLVLDKGGGSEDTTLLWSSEVPGAASASMRALRKKREAGIEVAVVSSDSSWAIYTIPTIGLKMRSTWLPAPGLLGPALAQFTARSPGTVSDYFSVRLGVRAGDRDVFVLPKDQYAELPKSERDGFKPIAEKNDIDEGRITPTRYLFVAGEAVLTEDELLNTYPVYANRFLLPAKDTLSERTRIEKNRWWRLAEARNTWKNSTEPRIVSRRWVRNNGYAVDADGAFAVVQGYAWFPLASLKNDIASNRLAGNVTDILRLYCIMFSSDIFFKILREFSTNASGGQIDLQQKYLNQVPLPLIPSSLTTDRELRLIVDRFDLASFPSLPARNAFAARCYGLDVESL